MITIDELSLRLPPGFEGRARGIVRLLAEALAAAEPTEELQARRLVVPPVEIPRGASDAQVAKRIAGAILTELRRTR